MGQEQHEQHGQPSAPPPYVSAAANALRNHVTSLHNFLVLLAPCPSSGVDAGVGHYTPPGGCVVAEPGLLFQRPRSLWGKEGGGECADPPPARLRSPFARLGVLRCAVLCCAARMPLAGEREEWVVQKFGGTGVGKYLTSIVHEVVPYCVRGRDAARSSVQAQAQAQVPDPDQVPDPGQSGLPRTRVAVVCSARSGLLKAQGTTALLLRAAQEALGPCDPSRFRAQASAGTAAGVHYSAPRSPSLSEDFCASHTFLSTVRQVMEEHLAAARTHIRHLGRLAQLEAQLQDDCARLRDILLAARVRQYLLSQLRGLCIWKMRPIFVLISYWGTEKARCHTKRSFRGTDRQKLFYFFLLFSSCTSRSSTRFRPAQKTQSWG